MKTPAISDTPAWDTVHPLTISELEHTATNAGSGKRTSLSHSRPSSVDLTELSPKEGQGNNLNYLSP